MAGIAVGSLTALLVVGQAWLLSRQVAGIATTRQLDGLGTAVALLAAIFLGRAALAWVNSWLGHRAAAAVKAQLRTDVMAARLSRPSQSTTSTGRLIALVTQGLDALDGYYARYLPQLVLAVTVPLIVGVAILSSDLTSAVIVALTVPLIPFFMALVGWVTEARLKKRWRAQSRLAHHFADLVAGLPTLQVFGRARAQARGLVSIEASHRKETMATLRVSFLSALVLELISTLSVALVAVGIGLRVVHGELGLATGLFVLMLAPEVYLPIRQVGVHFHDSADGVAAVEQAFEVIDADETDGQAERGDQTPQAADDPSGPLVSFRDVSVRYPGQERPALDSLSFELAPGELVAVAGPSGGGKSTALAVLMGFVTPSSGEVWLDGRPLRDVDLDDWRALTAWVAQNPGMLPGTVGDNVALGFPQASPTQLRAALDAVGGASLPLGQRVFGDTEGLSAGELRRVGLARAWLRVRHGGARLLVMDEPTAGLDVDTEAHVIDELRSLGVTALVVSHRPALLAAADRVLSVGAPAEAVR